MTWIAPSENDTLTGTLEKRLWDTADQFRANSGLKAQEYSGPILGIIFLRFAEDRFIAQRTKLEKAAASSRRGNRVDEPAAYHAEGFLYLAPNARFDFLLNLPEAKDIGAKVNEAIRDIEKHNPQLSGVLPKTYNLFTSILLKDLLKKIYEIPASVDFDAFGRIYEYFLGQFACTEGQKGGEFYTPSCIVRPAHRGHRALPRAHPRPRVRDTNLLRPIGSNRLLVRFARKGTRGLLPLTVEGPCAEFEKTPQSVRHLYFINKAMSSLPSCFFAREFMASFRFQAASWRARDLPALASRGGGSFRRWGWLETPVTLPLIVPLYIFGMCSSPICPSLNPVEASIAATAGRIISIK